MWQEKVADMDDMENDVHIYIYIVGIRMYIARICGAIFRIWIQNNRLSITTQFSFTVKYRKCTSRTQEWVHICCHALYCN